MMRRGDEDLLPTGELAMKGMHNAANALAAHALMSAIGAPPRPLAARCASSRACRIASSSWPRAGGVRFYDDSKGTNVGAAVAALEGFREPVVLIAGGEGKGQDFCAARARREGARARGDPHRAGRPGDRSSDRRDRCRPSRLAQTMELAVAAAFARAEPGDAVLLSPACASFDMFRQLRPPRRRFRRGRPIAGARLMLYSPARRVTDIDPALVWSALLLTAFGLVMVYSASIAMAEAERFSGYRASYFLVRHGVSLAVGLGPRGGLLSRAGVAVAARRAVALPRRHGDAGRGADSGDRARGERQPPLDSPRASQASSPRSS
jgi:hypothetical protein